MLKVKDWLKGQKYVQFNPTEYYDTPHGQEIMCAVRINDGGVFRLITQTIINIDYFYEQESGETIKIMLGISKFCEDNIHVNIVCLTEVLNSNIKSHHIKCGVQINEIEKHYLEVTSISKESAISKIRKF